MKPFVIVEGKWQISSYEKGYVLQRGSKVKGDLKWKARGYYSTIGDCFAGCLSESVRESKKELPQALRESIHTLKSASDRLRQDLSVKL